MKDLDNKWSWLTKGLEFDKGLEFEKGLGFEKGLEFDFFFFLYLLRGFYHQGFG